MLGRIAKPPLPRIAPGSAEPPAAARRPDRPIIVDDDRPIRCAVYDRDQLLAGNVIPGPAIVEEPASSTLLGLSDRAVVNEYGHLVIQLQEA